MKTNMNVNMTLNLNLNLNMNMNMNMKKIRAALQSEISRQDGLKPPLQPTALNRRPSHKNPSNPELDADFLQAHMKKLSLLNYQNSCKSFLTSGSKGGKIEVRTHS